MFVQVSGFLTPVITADENKKGIIKSFKEIYKILLSILDSIRYCFEKYKYKNWLPLEKNEIINFLF